jgi:hypothetical protein
MKRLYDLANCALLSLIGVLVVQSHPRLPARVPAHFNLAGRPDRWGAKNDLVVLFILPAVITVVLYVLMGLVARYKSGSRSLNIPHRQEFLRLPPDRQQPYWDLYREFFAGLAAGMNLLFYLFIKGSIDVALGTRASLPLKAGLPAFAVIGVLMVFYFWRLLAMPGRLIRG